MSVTPYSLLYRPGDVVELRMPGTTQGTIAGFFDDMDKLAKASPNSIVDKSRRFIRHSTR